jgi:hypothetical protein
MLLQGRLRDGWLDGVYSGARGSYQRVTQQYGCVKRRRKYPYGCTLVEFLSSDKCCTRGHGKP